MEETKKFRSPQFPFIPLEKAVVRAREFEAQYRTHPARVANAVKTWSYGEKSSGGIQTIAALSAFGLMEDDGSLENRKLKLTPLAQTILKDVRAGAAATALKTAALKPKVIAELWGEWGANRPPDSECISTLHLDKAFSEEAAGRLLGIYDATIRYAGLAEGDKRADNGDSGADDGGGGGADDPPSFDPPAAARGKVPLMANERVIFAHELRPDQSFRIVAAGDVDAKMVDALKAFANFQETLLKSSTANKSDSGQKTE